MALARCMAIGLACLILSTASAQSANTRTFSVPGHGGLVLDIPSGWRASTRAVDTPPSAVVRIEPPTGNAFVVQITAIWLAPEKRAALTPAELKARVQKSADELLPQAVEKQATLVELRGKKANGFYFSLTDRAPTADPRDYKYATQGTLLVGELVTVFTFFHQQADDPAKREALRMLAGARQAGR